MGHALSRLAVARLFGPEHGVNPRDLLPPSNSLAPSLQRGYPLLVILSTHPLFSKPFLDLRELLPDATHRHEGAADDRHRSHDGKHRPEHEARGDLR